MNGRPPLQTEGRHQLSRPAAFVATCMGAGALGLVSGSLMGRALQDDPQDVTANIDAEVLVDATVIEMHGYGPTGEPGTFLYDCKYEHDRLVCTQREPAAP